MLTKCMKSMNGAPVMFALAVSLSKPGRDILLLNHKWFMK